MNELELNNNMRCFEMQAERCSGSTVRPLNNNMRCFEMPVSPDEYEPIARLNNNMRCFEILKMLRVIPVLGS